MREKLSTYVDGLIGIILLFVAGITPLLFFNQTTEFYEMPKLILLVVATILLLGLWIFSWILKGKIVITRTPLDVPLLALLVVVIASAYFSATRNSAIYGNFPRVHGSAISWVTYILLYFVTVSNLKSVTAIKNFLYVMYGSGAIVAFLSILSFFHIFLPIDFAQAVNFTPTGSSFSTIAFLMMLMPLPLLSIVNQNKYMPLPAAIVLASLFGVTIALIGSLTIYIVLAIMFIVAFFATKPSQLKKAAGVITIPVALIVLALVLAYVPIPGLGAFQQLESNFPKEIQLPLEVSWKVSASAFRDAPMLGTGPASYLFNFTSYKPLEFNQLTYWNFTFDTAYDEFLQFLGTLGVLGLVSLIALCLVAVNFGRNNLLAHTRDDQDPSHIILSSMSISAIVAVVLLFVHGTTLVSIVATLFVFACLMVSQRSIREHVTQLSMGIKASTAADKQFDLLPIIVFVIFLILAVPGLIQTYKTVAADYYHRQALLQANKSGNLTYSNLQKAEALNPYIDLYRVDMAQTNFALANAIAIRKGPSKDNPNGSLTDQDKRTVQTLLSQAINEGRVSVALSPRSSRNWEVLASIYRNITGVAQNALAFSLDAYGRAIQMDPLNPSLRLSVGGIYYSVKNYDLAIRFFTDAANLKPDNANAYYNLAIALRDKGDLQNAKVVADQAVSLLSKVPNGPDYKVATALDKELADKIANANSSNEATASTQPNSALANPNLPGVDVNGLNNPPSSATPSAVKQNPKANLPQIKPTAAPAK
ncbi:MAG TPA: O-antigen ligase family protein [Patescibacteria group bacterium]|nr:O-antigen ligase family protein [Patescibacteria group bacterium]